MSAGWLFGHNLRSGVENHLLRLSEEGYVMYPMCLVMDRGQENS